ncbi:LuxR C-terminal-related transcriptional regulator [Streptomyces sp. NPDC041068]|uniref:helix-turn-helix transcriptional regulator n=1 Tax=Streptomyces sp. NPDC041068 TaxID=3155130 RepID=UPI0033E8F81A
MTAQQGSGDLWEAAVGVRAAARDAAGGTGGAQRVLAALGRVVEFDHASLARWDPQSQRHTTLAGSYPDAATAYIEASLHRDPVFAVLHGPSRGGLWLTDVPEELLSASPGFRDVLAPLGIEGGVAQCLFAADGRYVGMLNVSTCRSRRVPEPVRAAVTLLTEALAAAIDPGAAVPARPHTPPGPGAPPTPPGPGAPSAVSGLAAAAAGPEALPVVSGLPAAAAGGPARSSQGRRPDGGPGGLSPRELEVLAELTEGRTNREIAQRLYITPRTVATHIEHILAKLDLPNRAAAAARAVSWGIGSAR